MSKVLALLNLALLIAFPVAWAAPILRAGVLPFFGMSEISVLSGIRSLLESDPWLALLVALLALVAPYVKILTLAGIQFGYLTARALPLVKFAGRLAMAEGKLGPLRTAMNDCRRRPGASLFPEFDRRVEILAEVLLAGFADAAISEFGTHPLLAAFAVGAVVPDHGGGLARADTAADIEIAPLGLVLGNLQVDDPGIGLVGDYEMPFIGSVGLYGHETECGAKQGVADAGGDGH